MVAGGAESAFTPLGLGSFGQARALSTRNDEPTRASRPWDRDRDGFVMSEGAGAIILEEYEHARARRAQIYAEFAGFGMSGDAFHITSPPEDGEGARLAMTAAIRDAGVNAADVQYINAHATSTELGDIAETVAIKRAFGDHARKVAVSSTKSMTGHLLGAAGVVEAIFSILAIRDGILPPTINLENPDPACDLDYVPGTARRAPVRVALSNSFGFGGTNGSLVFRAPQ
jgi:3-oxoacyl-[acyl-carrier-protein] synthase II